MFINTYSLIFNGRFIHRIFSSSLILLLAISGLVLFSGRSFCGWICPLGAIQGLVGWISRKNKTKPPKYPISSHSFSKWARLTLIGFTGGAWYGGKLLIRPYDPWAAFMHISEFTHALDDFLVGALVLALSLTASVFIGRFFCRFLCPMGGFLDLFSRFSMGYISAYLLPSTNTKQQVNLCRR